MNDSKKALLEHIKEVYKTFSLGSEIRLSNNSVICEAQENIIDLLKNKIVSSDTWKTPQTLQSHGMSGIELEIYRFCYENKHLLVDWTANFQNEKTGAYQIEWTSGGRSYATVYMSGNGTKMIVCANWVGPCRVCDLSEDSIKQYQRL